LQLRYIRGPETIGAPEHVLGLVRFGAEPAAAAYPVAGIAMAELDHGAGAELWTSALPVRYGSANGIRYADNGQVLFGAIADDVPADGTGFERRVGQIYDAAFELCQAQGHPHLLRVWNYFPQINQARDGLETYQRFCRARALAFQARFGEFVPRLPSASAIGSHGGRFVLYFIAARAAGLHRENPRQLSAYSYPPQYGPRSPSFARATLYRHAGQELFFISGTASIVGHESMHRGDVCAQLDETLRNIETLIESTGRDEAVRLGGLGDIDFLKVYLRRPADLAPVRARLRERLGEAVQVLYLHGEICRSELLVEIEAVAGR
jgi:chorismate lyase/3-hydroxybenzoate synthase